MNQRTLMFLSLCIFAALGLGLLWLAKKDSVEAQSNTPPGNPLETINQKAKEVRNGDLSVAEEYVGEIIKVTGFQKELNGFTSMAIKDRVGRAEIRYQQGQISGISETKIVRTVNGLVRKFEIPAFAKTNIYEVRMLRLSLIPNFPQVINQKKQGIHPISVGEGMDSQMSPAEAFFILGMMLHQKLVNPEYQMTHQERVSNWAEKHNHGLNQNITLDPPQERSDEIRGALKRAVASASVMDALQLSELILNTLGIEQYGGLER